MMHFRTSSLLKVVVCVLYFQGSLAEAPFKKDGDAVKFDGSAQAGKTTLFVKSERLVVELKGDKVYSDVDVRPKFDFGSCKVEGRLSMNEKDGKSLTVDKCPMALSVVVTITKNSVKFAEFKSVDRSKSIICQPFFKPVKGGYAIDVGTDLGKSIKEFSITYKDASIYDASSEGSIGPLWIALIVVSGILIFSLSFGGSGFGLFKFIKRRRLAQAEHPIAQPPVKPIVKQAEKPESKTKVKTVDEVEEEKPEAPPKKKTELATIEEMPEKERKEPKPGKKATPEESTDLQTKSEDVLTMKRPAELRLKTAEFRPSVPFNAKLAEKTAIDDPEVEAKWKAARLASEGTIESDGPYEIPAFISKHYLKHSETLRKLLLFSAAERHLIIYFRDLCVRVFKRCEKMLDAIEKGWVKDVQTYEFRKEIIKIREICRQVYQSVQEGHNTAKMPWAFNSIEEIAQLDVHEIKWAFDVEPPTRRQAVAIKAGLKKLTELCKQQEASKDPALERTKKMLESISELDKLITRHYRA